MQPTRPTHSSSQQPGAPLPAQAAQRDLSPAQLRALQPRENLSGAEWQVRQRIDRAARDRLAEYLDVVVPPLVQAAVPHVSVPTSRSAPSTESAGPSAQGPVDGLWHLGRILQAEATILGRLPEWLRADRTLETLDLEIGALLVELWASYKPNEVALRPTLQTVLAQWESTQQPLDEQLGPFLQPVSTQQGQKSKSTPAKGRLKEICTQLQDLIQHRHDLAEDLRRSTADYETFMRSIPALRVWRDRALSRLTCLAQPEAHPLEMRAWLETVRARCREALIEVSALVLDADLLRKLRHDLSVYSKAVRQKCYVFFKEVDEKLEKWAEIEAQWKAENRPLVPVTQAFSSLRTLSILSDLIEPAGSDIRLASAQIVNYLGSFLNESSQKEEIRRSPSPWSPPGAAAAAAAADPDPVALCSLDQWQEALIEAADLHSPHRRRWNSSPPHLGLTALPPVEWVPVIVDIAAPFEMEPETGFFSLDEKKCKNLEDAVRITKKSENGETLYCVDVAWIDITVLNSHEGFGKSGDLMAVVLSLEILPTMEIRSASIGRKLIEVPESRVGLQSGISISWENLSEALKARHSPSGAAAASSSSSHAAADTGTTGPRGIELTREQQEFLQLFLQLRRNRSALLRWTRPQSPVDDAHLNRASAPELRDHVERLLRRQSSRSESALAEIKPDLSEATPDYQDALSQLLDASYAVIHAATASKAVAQQCVIPRDCLSLFESAVGQALSIFPIAGAAAQPPSDPAALAVWQQTQRLQLLERLRPVLKSRGLKSQLGLLRLFDVLQMESTALDFVQRGAAYVVKATSPSHSPKPSSSPTGSSAAAAAAATRPWQAPPLRKGLGSLSRAAVLARKRQASGSGSSSDSAAAAAAPGDGAL
jgi:hypothetical protein